MDYRNLRSMRQFHKNIYGFYEAIKYDLFDNVDKFENSPTDERLIEEITDIIGAMEDCINAAYYNIGIYAKTKNNPPIDEYFVIAAEKSFEKNGQKLDKFVNYTKKEIWGE